jgi:gamma-glutamylcyclotransferase (GGCT)/AIG2-like uncharacterized protein YtfP
MTNKHYYFGYGMNSNPDAMLLRTGKTEAIGRATILDHAFRFAVHADVYPDPGGLVHGVLWEIDDGALADLDIREGYPSYYTRKLVPVESGGKTYTAWMYSMTPGHQLALPDDYYYGMIEEGYRHFGIPLTQIIKARVIAMQKTFRDEIAQHRAIIGTTRK